MAPRDRAGPFWKDPVESHADILDHLIAFSSMTTEDFHDAANEILVIMEPLDKEHYNRPRRTRR